MSDQIERLERDVKRLKIYAALLTVLLILLTFAQYLPDDAKGGSPSCERLGHRG